MSLPSTDILASILARDERVLRSYAGPSSGPFSGPTSGAGSGCSCRSPRASASGAVFSTGGYAAGRSRISVSR